MPPFESALGMDGARQVWNLVQEAATEIKSRIARHGIECDLEHGHLWTSVLERRVQLLTDWQEEAARKWGYGHLRFIPKNEVPQHIGSDRYQAALLDEKGGHLHPLKYALGLARAAEGLGVQIFENTKALSYQETSDGVEVVTAQGKVRASRLVLACNSYVHTLDSHLKSRILPVGTYIIATEPLGEARARALLPTGHAVSDNQFVLDYFRLTNDGRLLFGGKCTYTGRTPVNLAEGMRHDMLKVFPQLADVKIEFAWGGHIDITMARTPDFGNEGPVYWAQGFSGHGIVPTCVAGRVIAQAILGDATNLALFQQLHNPPFPGGETLGALFQAVGMSYYRLRDYF
jgi:glycine/D-amino acid oxidase-like deaminating enzyme